MVKPYLGITDFDILITDNDDFFLDFEIKELESNNEGTYTFNYQLLKQNVSKQ